MQARTNWKHSYPYEPGETGNGAYIRFNMPGHSYTATVTSVDSLARWIAGEAKIDSYTIERPGDLSSAALAHITGDLLAGIEHVYSTPCGQGWSYALAGIIEWERAEDAAQQAALAAQVEVGDELTTRVNQGDRRAVVVAVQEGGDHCIIEYVMPNRRTYPGVAHKSNAARAINGTGDCGCGTYGSRTPKWAVEQMASAERAELVEELICSIEYDHPLTRRQDNNLWRAMAKGFTYMDLAKGGVDSARRYLHRLACEARRDE